MKTTFHTHFHVVRKKLNKRGLAPIFLKITVDGKRREYSITRRVEQKNGMPNWKK